ncbi:hypothetical protein JAAARDRAFT_68757 [Jaapia argillacea MUCL 33604]|uniref:Uncharacterized protein n=1 Tax=Jaapia argillacea MUCL 33604 TaxID=933084 RepID=A0A067PWR1_9AGAM|nr:hypothetical protein JAAARDRAFT_68757 [Jaapia argillacea MUCL 33604]
MSAPMQVEESLGQEVHSISYKNDSAGPLDDPRGTDLVVDRSTNSFVLKPRQPLTPTSQQYWDETSCLPPNYEEFTIIRRRLPSAPGLPSGSASRGVNRRLSDQGMPLPFMPSLDVNWMNGTGRQAEGVEEITTMVRFEKDGDEWTHISRSRSASDEPTRNSDPSPAEKPVAASSSPPNSGDGVQPSRLPFQPSFVPSLTYMHRQFAKMRATLQKNGIDVPELVVQPTPVDAPADLSIRTTHPTIPEATPVDQPAMDVDSEPAHSVNAIESDTPPSPIDQPSPEDARHEDDVALAEVLLQIGRSPTSEAPSGGPSHLCSPERREQLSEPRAKKRPRLDPRDAHCRVGDCQWQSPSGRIREVHRHRDAHFPSRWQCPGCLKLFSRPDPLLRHLKTVSCASCREAAGPEEDWGVNVAKFAHESYWDESTLRPYP